MRCPEDSYQDNEGSAACIACSSLGGDLLLSRTFGITGAWTRAACVACPEGAQCNDNTVRQSMKLTDSNGTTTHRPEVFTSAQWAALSAQEDVGDIPLLQSAAANEIASLLSWCPDGCLCIDPQPNRYRFPPNTCVAQPNNLGCPNCPISDLECLKCPLYETVNMEYECAHWTTDSGETAGVCNAEILSGCSEGYAGYGCLTCDQGFTRSGDFECRKCMDANTTFALIFVLVLVATGVTAYMVRSTIQSKGEPKEAKPMIIKLVVSHLQIVALVALFPLEWPQGVKTFFAIFAASSVSGGEAALFSVDCALAEWELFSSPFYALATVQAMLPFLVLALTGLFWTGLKYYRVFKGTHRPDQHYRRYMVVSVVVVLFMLHITLTKTALAFFTCTNKVGGGPQVGNRSFNFLEVDTRIECSGGHTTWAYGLGIGMIVFYAFGIPLASFVVLRKVKVLGLEQWRTVFGFLYSSYEERCWYWEVTVAFRKALFAAAAVLLEPKGVDIQANFGVLVIVTSLGMQLQVSRFK